MHMFRGSKNRCLNLVFMLCWVLLLRWINGLSLTSKQWQSADHNFAKQHAQDFHAKTEEAPEADIEEKKELVSKVYPLAAWFRGGHLGSRPTHYCQTLSVRGWKIPPLGAAGPEEVWKFCIAKFSSKNRMAGNNQLRKLQLLKGTQKCLLSFHTNAVIWLCNDFLNKI